MESKKESAIQHWSHYHPLHYVEEQTNQSKKVICSLCREMVSGPSFSCAECKYHLHKKCVQAPTIIVKHPLHREHFRLLLEADSTDFKRYGCHLCNEKRNMFVYQCYDCNFFIDINCALASLNILGKTFPKVKQQAHQHPLIFIENHHDELKRTCCSWCQKPLVDSIYICMDCNFYLHKKCVNLPLKINHPCHRQHPLILNFDVNNHYCKLCQQNNEGYSYSCSLCKFDIDIKCVWQRPVIEDESCHKHPFTLLWRQESFICDACGMEGNYVSYICSICHLQVHQNCTSLPHAVKISRHGHPLLHHFSLQQEELESQDCGICLDEVKIEHGSYYCFRGDCKYIVHVNCVIEDYEYYDRIDQVDQDEESIDYLALQSDDTTDSSITDVIEVNAQGEATKIKHLLHENDLILGDKINEEDDKCCDGCMLSISTSSFYYCSQCNFLLHKSCAESSRNKHLWFFNYSTTLASAEIFTCRQCNRLCSGFCYLDLCLRCAILSDTLKRQGHKHLLSFDFKFRGQCNACGVNNAYNGAYRCKACNYAVDFKCMSLPHATRHKCDEHLLELTYHDENVYPEQHYCDICEKKRDPNHWFYHCRICDTSVHPTCVFGKYSFVKVGWTHESRYHPHRLTSVRSKIYDHPRCSECGKHCEDLAFKCPEPACDYIVHLECL
ncbi:uncharacterized protein LOC111297711 [Durio zibethinus]|uniref:Uncharacterized protein LOC111297711 n=1 Tax=Durio zibethinus TaxID=66656 RepID=A0A6P5Z6A3_DURZI|nr:uncharacterized protein LOC111297711 [Durio zibethinus]